MLGVNCPHGSDKSYAYAKCMCGNAQLCRDVCCPPRIFVKVCCTVNACALSGCCMYAAANPFDCTWLAVGSVHTACTLLQLLLISVLLCMPSFVGIKALVDDKRHSKLEGCLRGVSPLLANA